MLQKNMGKDNKHSSIHLAWKYAQGICPWTLSVSQSSPLRKTVSFEKQIMSTDKWTSGFLCQMAVIVYRQAVFGRQHILVSIVCLDTLNSFPEKGPIRFKMKGSVQTKPLKWGCKMSLKQHLLICTFACGQELR